VLYALTVAHWPELADTISVFAMSASSVFAALSCEHSNSVAPIARRCIPIRI
jgi:hypothetical protein